MMANTLPFDIPSPCIGVCKILPDEEFCVGCLRTRNEIKIWRSTDNTTRLDILSELKERRHARGKIGRGEQRVRRRKKSD